jgi:hypothetical protein
MVMLMASNPLPARVEGLVLAEGFTETKRGSPKSDISQLRREAGKRRLDPDFGFRNAAYVAAESTGDDRPHLVGQALSATIA